MNDKPRRRWFRFHLATAVVVMLTFGVLLGIETAFGATLNEWLKTWVLALEKSDVVTADERAYLPFCIVFNVVAAVGAAVVSEFVIRRREGRN